MTHWARLTAAVAALALMTGGLSAGIRPAQAAPSTRGAAHAAPVPSNGSFAIAPTPALGGTQSAGSFSIVAVPGHKFAESVSVANLTKAPLRLYLYPADAYTIRRGGGFAVYGLHSTPRDVGAWVSQLPRVITIPARRQLNIRFTIRVPGNATPGEHAGGIVVQAVAPQVVQVNGSLRTEVYQQVFTRIYATVPGRLTPDFEVDSLGATHPQPPFPVVTHRAGMISYYLSNTGNVIIAPTVTLQVTGLFGTVLDKKVPAASELLPGGIASYDIAWPDVPAIGPVHVRLTVTSAYGLTRTADYSYTALPGPFLATTTSVVIVIIATAVFLLIRRRRRRLVQPRRHRLTAS
jgi:hypothetical protein